MKILFISTSIPPMTDMQSTRNVYLIDSLKKSGHIVEILTCENQGILDEKFGEILNKNKIYRTKSPKFLNFHNYLNKNLNIKFLKKIYNVFVNYIAIPDLYMFWNREAMKYISKNNFQKNYDLIITSSGSYTAHLLGYKLKRKKYAKKWIAEYGDPWGLDENGKIKKINYFLENKILKKCDGIIFTTKSTIEAYKTNYKSDILYELIPCGYDKIIEDGESKNKKLRFTYTGIAYKKARNLSGILEVISKYERKCELSLVGTFSESFKTEKKNFSNIFFKGRVKYNESLEIISKSDILVHIGNLGKLQIPGKTYIYLSSKKPILYIKQEKENDPTAKILSKFEGIVMCENNINEIKKAVEYILENYDTIKKEAEKRAKNKKLEMYKWSNLGEKFVNFIQKI